MTHSKWTPLLQLLPYLLYGALRLRSARDGDGLEGDDEADLELPELAGSLCDRHPHVLEEHGLYKIK